MLETLTLGLLFLVTLATRLYKIDHPDYVCWDETHFGKMAGLYINRTFFLDVHPPLGKLITAGTGHMFGYDGRYGFNNPGDYYTVNETEVLVPYISMRATLAVISSFVVPLAYSFVYTLTGSMAASILSSIFLIFDVGIITLSQYILLDGMLLVFLMLSVFCAIKVTSLQGIFSGNIKQSSKDDQSFTLSWWLWIVTTGVSLGCVMATKFVGLFTVIFVGIWTLWDLLNIVSDAKNTSILLFFKHFLSRVVGLIIVPLSVYLTIFWVHFKVLSLNGNSAYFFSTAFQASLVGNPFYNTSISQYVASGSMITLRGANYQSTLLHSHRYKWPRNIDDQELQQVTGYFAPDSNNLWAISKSNTTDNTILEIGDIVELIHVKTKSRLALSLSNKNHWNKAPLTKRNFLVSGIKDRNIATGSDKWRVQLESHQLLCTIDCHFSLVNVATGCHLSLGHKLLPEWAANQREVTCAKSSQQNNNKMWFVESVISSNTSIALKEMQTLSFLNKVFELHAVMLIVNSKLLPKPGEQWSMPWEWPLLIRGQMFSRSNDGIYLYGTPAIWNLVLLSIPLFIIIYIFLSIIHARQKSLTEANGFKTIKLIRSDSRLSVGGFESDLDACSTLFVGWIVHYFPFYLMNRVLFFHHYFPAFVFACCFAGTFLNFLCRILSTYVSSYCKLHRGLIHSSMLVVLSALVLSSFHNNMKHCYGV